MSKGVNKALLIGNLGNDPEIRHTAEGGAVANITVATSESWRDKQSGETKEQTEWHRVVAFGKLAEIIGQYLHKGSKVYIEGQIKTRKWQGKDGQDKYTTEIVARDMQMLDGKGDGSRATGGGQASNQGQEPEPPAQGGYDYDDSDLPF